MPTASSQVRMLRPERRGPNTQTAAAARQADHQILRPATQNTGAPINRSRRVPPPTPVTAAKKPKVTMSCLRRAAASAPVAPNTATAA